MINNNGVLMIFFCLILFSISNAFSQGLTLLGAVEGLDIEPPVGIPLAGYGSKERRLPSFYDWRSQHSESSLFKPSEGYHSPIRSKVIVLKKGDEFIVFISLDTIGVETRFVKEVAKKLAPYGIKEKNIIMSATHTHGGPGTLSKRVPLMLVAVDFYKERNYQHVLKKVVSSVEGALSKLEPVSLHKTIAEIEGVQENKWRKKDENHFDNRATFIFLKSLINDHYLGGLISFSIHGGTMPVGLMQYSSDVNGAIEKRIEDYFQTKNFPFQDKVTFLFMNGAEGDVGGALERSVESVEKLADQFLESSIPSLEAKYQDLSMDIRTEKRRVFVGVPALPLNCQSGLGSLPSWFKVPIAPLLPMQSDISYANVGGVSILTWPGEPSTQLGFDLQNLAKKYGFNESLVFGLTNDYMTYFTTKAEYKEKAYDSCSSFYGWRGGNRILKAHERLLQSL
jgi:hypothetical protein